MTVTTEPAASQFWRIDFRVPFGPDRSATSLVPLPAGAGYLPLCVEIVYEKSRDDGDYAVLLSTAERNCFIAFVNAPRWGDRLRESGFNCVEADIGPQRQGEGTVPQGGVTPLVVRIPFYPPVADSSGGPGVPPDATTSRRYVQFLTIGGVDFSQPVTDDAALVVEPLRFTQRQSVPEPGRPKAEMATFDSTVLMGTARVAVVDGARSAQTDTAAATIEIAESRYPDLTPISGRGALQGWRVQRGIVLGWPGLNPSLVANPSERRTERRPRRNPFGAPNFSFLNVDSIGFRIDLSPFGRDADALLEQLIAPLNFHTQSQSAATPFRFTAASHTLVIELLHYGKMIDADSPALRPDDFTSQHELALRLLVGRVDDDTAQARLPAVFVPAIFVDNPWSKVVGREQLGYDKQLAQFCVGDQSLGMDGREPGKAVRQDLAAVDHLKLVSRVGRDDGLKVLSIQCPASDDATFTRVDVPALLSSDAIGPWMQSDFAQPEFRRGFARSVMDQGFMKFQSIQNVPVDRRELPSAWVSGTYTLSDVEVAFPAGIATLTFPTPEKLAKGTLAAPEAWTDFCKLLSRQPLALPTGEWYRLRCSMTLAINDLLDG